MTADRISPFVVFSQLGRWSLIAGTAVCLLSCGQTDDRIAVYPVSGKVVYRGEPAQGANVVFYSVERRDPKVPIPKAEVQEDGSFALTSYTKGDGAPAGTYRVTIEWLEPIPEGANPKTYSPADRLGQRYATPDRTNLKVTIEEGENVLEPFQLD